MRCMYVFNIHKRLLLIIWWKVLFKYVYFGKFTYFLKVLLWVDWFLSSKLWARCMKTQLFSAFFLLICLKTKILVTVLLVNSKICNTSRNLHRNWRGPSDRKLVPWCPRRMFRRCLLQRLRAQASRMRQCSYRKVLIWKLPFCQFLAKFTLKFSI